MTDLTLTPFGTDGAFRDRLEALIRQHHPDLERLEYEVSVDDGATVDEDKRVAVRIEDPRMIVHAPDGPELIVRLNRILEHRAEHGPPEEPPPSAATVDALELLDADEYGAARAHVMNITQAVGVVPLEAIDRLIATAEQSLAVTVDGLVARGLTRQEAEESRAALELEHDLFLAFKAFLSRAQRIAGEARASMPVAGVLDQPRQPGPAASPGATAKPPPPPPRKR